MKLSTNAVSFGPKVKVNMDLLKHAESLGYDSAWTAEAWGHDAVTTATWVAAQTTKLKVGTAIMQMPARSPAMTAMTATTLNQLSEGRFMLGLGPSGPQVVEGWHGVPYGTPLARTKESIEIIRKIWAREEPLTFQGEHYSIPCTGEGTTNLGKPLKSILHGNPDLKIFTASIAPAGVACSAEVADGVFPVWMNPDRFDLFEDSLNKGFAKAGGGKTLENFEINPFVTAAMVVARPPVPITVVGQARSRFRRCTIPSTKLTYPNMRPDCKDSMVFFPTT